MAVDAWHELGPVAGVCRLCGIDGALRLGEFRSRPVLRDRLRGARSQPTSRLVHCLSCDWRWTVRKDDGWLPVASTFQSRAVHTPPTASPRPPGERRTARPAPAQQVPVDRDARTPVPWPRSCERRRTSGIG